MAIQISYILAIIPLYILVYVPLSNFLLPNQNATHQSNALNLSLIATQDADIFDPATCPPHTYQTHILSQDPLIIYVENFLSENERDHLVSISEDKFEPSTVTVGGGNTARNSAARLSEVALLDRDTTVRCIEQRARSFQGWRSNLHIERLRTQRYGEGGHYTHHFDWSSGSRMQNRISTFMVYVQAKELVGGGTEFPRLEARRDGRWCEFLECGEETEDAEKGDKAMGITFKPIAGNAVFWVNMAPDGRGYAETWHAGLPVVSGQKIGLNIWSWGSAR